MDRLTPRAAPLTVMAIVDLPKPYPLGPDSATRLARAIAHLLLREALAELDTELLLLNNSSHAKDDRTQDTQEPK